MEERRLKPLAAKAGLNVIFDRDFRSPVQIPLFDSVDVLDALDLLSLQTKTFWEFMDATTILVSPDNQTKRRDYSQLVVKTIYLMGILRGCNQWNSSRLFAPSSI
jgi:type II secretory pathway component HofQ